MNERIIGEVVGTGIMIVVIILLVSLAIYATKSHLNETPQLPIMCLDGVEYYSTKYNLTPRLRNENGNMVLVTCQEKQ